MKFKMFKRSEAELVSEIEQALARARTNQMKPGVVLYEFGTMQLRINELDKRTNRALSYIALLVSLLSLGLTAAYSFYDYQSTKLWEEQQIELLKSIEAKI